MHDSLTQLLRIAVSTETAASRRIVGSRQPSVPVLVPRTALEAGEGNGRIEGCDIPISLEAVERIACESGTVQLDFDESGRPLDLGREQRLYSKRQRIALAAAQGGCMFGGCDRPPSWCEAHYTKHWKRDFGKTNIEDGILPCRYHHVLVHNNRWEIVRTTRGSGLSRLVRLMRRSDSGVRPGCAPALEESSDEGGRRSRGDHHDDEWCPQSQQNGRHRKRGKPRVDDDPSARAERLHRSQRRKQGHREQVCYARGRGFLEERRRNQIAGDFERQAHEGRNYHDEPERHATGPVRSAKLVVSASLVRSTNPVMSVSLGARVGGLDCQTS